MTDEDPVVKFIRQVLRDEVSALVKREVDRLLQAELEAAVPQLVQYRVRLRVF